MVDTHRVKSIRITHSLVRQICFSVAAQLRIFFRATPNAPLDHFVERLNAFASEPEGTENVLKEDIFIAHLLRQGVKSYDYIISSLCAQGLCFCQTLHALRVKVAESILERTMQTRHTVARAPSVGVL